MTSEEKIRSISLQIAQAQFVNKIYGDDWLVVAVDEAKRIEYFIRNGFIEENPKTTVHKNEPRGLLEK